MWIVRVALQRPYTFIVLAIVILLLGALAIARTPVDILPAIRIPVVATIWNYDGLSPQEMATRFATFSERSASVTVNDIEHSESQSLSGKSVIKFFFQPTVNEDLAYAQITGVSQFLVRYAPPGATPPFVLAYDASTVPIIQLAFSSPTLPEVQLFDTTNNIVRVALASVPGAAAPYPYGGALRQVQVDLNPAALRAHNLSALDVSAAIGAQNLILPAGIQKIGDREHYIRLNAGVRAAAELNDVPIRTANGVTTYVGDVAQVRDGSAPQTNIVRLEGKRAVLMSVLKTGTASTLDVINGIRARLPALRAALPANLSINALADQSVFVRASVAGVLREGLIAATLTGLMILLFLGSWRSTAIIAISIPLAALASVVCLSALGETINIMTLGGLALAVGILVDDATVTVEAIHRQLAQGMELRAAILEGARQIALPALVSTLGICIVFVPMFYMPGIAGFLFRPLAEAVIFAMLASYLLSRTLVPTLAWYWLPTAPAPPGNRAQRWQQRFQQAFEGFRERYRLLLARSLARGASFAWMFLAAMAATALLAFPIGPLPGLGQNFFPAVDAGQIKLHLRAPSGTRIESTAALCDRVEAAVRAIIPVRELAAVADNIGVPNSGINLAYSTSAPVGPGDADILLSLNPGHRATDYYVRALRRALPAAFPGVSFAFLPADIVNQILNFGQPAPLDLQIAGGNLAANRAYARELMEQLQQIPGLSDVRQQQSFDFPQIDVSVDRTRAQALGYTQLNVANNLLISLSGTAQASPSFWVDPDTGTQYNVTTQTPQYRLNTLDALGATPITAGAGGSAQLLANLATFRRSTAPTLVSHYNAAPVLDIYAAPSGIDLGFVADRVNAVTAAAAAHLPKGTHVAMRGQVETMQASFRGLLLGLAGAVILVYLLIVVNFQSWLDPLIIISALPAALAGIVWMLFLTHTTVSVPALTGAIMCMGVATANSILVVSFARERFDAGGNALQSALDAGHARLRPVLMTALAMVLGMLPVALGIGEGGEQNAPLGRAVIGGLIFATVATLFFVPVVFTLIHGRGGRRGQLPGELTMEEPRTRALRRRALLLLLTAAVLLGAWGIYFRLAQRATLGDAAAAASIPVVAVTQPVAAGGSHELVLPATLTAFSDAPVYARTSGYLRRWLVDIGAHVRRGQLLAEIDAPEIDQQWQQGRADLALAEANARLAQSTATRWQQLLNSGSVARQDVDDKLGDAEAKAAAAASARANLQRLQELESFKRIVAPFDGVITARHTDVGALISAGTGAAAGSGGGTGELFHIAATGKLRVYVSVPQAYAEQVHKGQRADISLSERPDSREAAIVVSTADAIDPVSRTLLVQLELADAGSTMLPGTYVEVHLQVQGAAASLRIPSNALLFRADGLSVVKVTADNRMLVAPVTVGRDFGNSIEVTSGLAATDRIVLSPPESAQTGTVVRVAATPSGHG